MGHKDTWGATGLVTGAIWAEIETCGRQVRRLWVTFARGEDLGETENTPGALRHRRARP